MILTALLSQVSQAEIVIPQDSVISEIVIEAYTTAATAQASNSAQISLESTGTTTSSILARVNAPVLAGACARSRGTAHPSLLIAKSQKLYLFTNGDGNFNAFFWVVLSSLKSVNRFT